MRRPSFSRLPIATALLLILALTTLLQAQVSTPPQARLQRLEAALTASQPQPIKCGLADVLHWQQQPHSYSPLQQQFLVQATTPAILDQFYISPSGRFKIHYTQSGPDAVVETSTNAAGVPDFVYVAAEAADLAYRLLVEEVGFVPHAPDTVDGPEFDIYFRNLEIYYGLTQRDSRTGQTYITIENDFAGGFFTTGVEAVQVTIVHEYFHAIQFEYSFRLEDLFFFEMTSVWFEDFAYPEINDYLQYLSELFKQPQLPLHVQNGWHEYGSGLFLKFWLAQRNVSSLRRIWEGSRQKLMLRAIEEEILANDLTFADVMASYFSWFLYTGRWHEPGQYFDDARLFPEVRFSFDEEIAADTMLTAATRPLSGVFYRLTVDPAQDFSALFSNLTGEDFRLAGAGELLTGKLGLPIIAPRPVGIEIAAAANEGVVHVVAVNGKVPEDPRASPLGLRSDSFDLVISFRELRERPVGLQPPTPNPLRPENQSVYISYNLPENDRLMISIISETGQLVWERDLGARPVGLSSIDWNGRNQNGERVASGIYIIVLQGASGRKEFRKLAVVR